MARTKQRETYGNGSVSAVTVPKLDADGSQVMGRDGKPVRVQKRDRMGNPVWRVCVTLGTEEYVEGGKLRRRQRKVQKTYHGTLKEARDYCGTLVEQYERVDADRARDTFTDLCERWSRSDELADCSKGQRKQYMRLLGLVAPYLDKKPLVEVGKRDVNEAMAKAVILPDGRELADSTAKKMRATVHRVFEYAVEEDDLPANPCHMRRRRRGGAHQAQTVQRRSLSEEEAARLCACLDASEAEEYRLYAEKEARQARWGNTFGRSSVRGLGALSNILAARLMLATGMRRGEALGLTWANVDLDAGTVRVCQTLNKDMEIRSPKSDSGNRSLYIDAHTVEHLRRWKAFQAKALHLVNVDGVALTQGGNTPVFCTDSGTMVNPYNCYHWWSGYRDEHGFDGIVLHELRHTQITLLKGYAATAESGITIEMIKQRVGHAKDTGATRYYEHELPAMDGPAAEVMGRILYERGAAKGAILRMAKTA